MNEQTIITIQDLLKLSNRNNDFYYANPKRIKLFRHSQNVKQDSVVGKDYIGWSVYKLYHEKYDKFIEFQKEQNDTVMMDVDYMVVFIGEEQNTARFVGVFKNNGQTHKTSSGYNYDLEELDEFKLLKDHVVINWGKSRSWKQNWDTTKEVVWFYKDSNPAGVPYFTRYEDVVLDYNQLNMVIKEKEWKARLDACNCVYAILDKRNGKQYVGVTYKDVKPGLKSGILSRWTEYAKKGHGGDEDLEKLCLEDPDYAKNNFQWSILETLPINVIASVAVERENKWKDKLGTRDNGYNNN